MQKTGLKTTKDLQKIDCQIDKININKNPRIHCRFEGFLYCKKTMIYKL